MGDDALGAVHGDLSSQQVVALAIKPAFKPLFKAWLDNDHDGSRSLGLTLGKIDVVHGDPDWVRSIKTDFLLNMPPHSHVKKPNGRYLVGSRRRISDNQEHVLIDSARSGKSLRVTAAELGVSHETVRQTLIAMRLNKGTDFQPQEI